MNRFNQMFATFGAMFMTLAATGQVTFLDESFAYDEARPARGVWVGNVALPSNPGTSVFAMLIVEAGDDGGLESTMTLLQVGAMNKQVDAIESGDATLSVTVAGPGGEFRFTGEVDETGQRLSGEVTLWASGEVKGEPSSFEFVRALRPQDLDEHMAFTGALAAQGVSLGMTMVFARTPGGNWVGHLDVPMQGLQGFPFINVTEDEGTIRAELPIPGGVSVELTLSGGDQRLSGIFNQRGTEMKIDLARDANYSYQSVERPQDPKPPFPYEARDVVVDHPDGFQIAGTLTLPDASAHGPGPYPAAILISGSGQQDRNEALMGHKPFLVIADHLTRAGIAVMRSDDRGIGGSGGLESLDVATSEDFASDTLAVLNHLKTIDAIDPAKIGLIGHSEGGMIAPMVGTMTDDVAFMVLMAGPGVRGDEVLAVQRRLISMAAGVSEEEFNDQEVVVGELIAMTLEGVEVDDIVEHALKRARETNPEASLNEEQFRARTRAQLQMLTSSWMKYFLAYDPRPALEQVRCPIFAINGTKDLQVWHEQNLDAIAAILSKTGVDFAVKRYVGLNHLFQPAETGSIGEYAEIETTIDETVLRDMARWITSKVK